MPVHSWEPSGEPSSADIRPRADSLPIAYLTWVIAVAAGLGHGPVDVVARQRPAGQHAAREVVYSKGSRHAGFGLPGSGAMISRYVRGPSASNAL
jgi:hypothetical protein